MKERNNRNRFDRLRSLTGRPVSSSSPLGTLRWSGDSAAKRETVTRRVSEGRSGALDVFPASLADASGYFPSTQIRCFTVRRNRHPCEMAGEAKIGSPTSFLAISVYSAAVPSITVVTPASSQK